MNTITDSAWRPPVELAVLPQAIPVEPPPAVQGGDGDGQGDDDGFRIFGDDGFTFFDFLDIINPLHHIPVVGTLYRHFSGDQIDPGARVFGGTLFFGPIGTVASIGDVLVRDATGKDMGQHVMAFFDENQGQPAPAPEVAEAAPTVVADSGAPSAYAAAAADTAEPSEALDPVTAWAMEETAYRQAMAAKIQASTQARPEIRERASAPMPAVAAAYDASRRALVTAGLAEPVPALPARLAIDSDAASSAQSIIRHSRQSAAMYAAATYGGGDKPAAPSKRAEAADAESPRPAATPPGAVAPLGGWFTDAMLKANENYRAGAGAAGSRLPTTLDVTR